MHGTSSAMPSERDRCALGSTYCARGHMGDGDRVHISRASSDLKSLHRAVVMIGMTVFFNAAFSIQNEHALSVGFLQSIMVGFRWVRDITGRRQQAVIWLQSRFLTPSDVSHALLARAGAHCGSLPQYVSPQRRHASYC